MSTLNLNTAELVSTTNSPFEEAHMAAAAFLARYSGRTLETYRFDLRSDFEWCAGVGLAVLEAKRAHIELWRAASEQRSLAASTIDRRLSTICGYYRFAHIDGRISANPAQYVRRPKVHASEGRGLDRGELGTFLFTAERYDRDHAALAVLLGLNGLRVSEACATNSEDLGFDRGHRTLRIIGKGNKPAVIPSSHGWPARSTSCSPSAARARSCTAGTASASTVARHIAGYAVSARGPGWDSSTLTCSERPSS
jgi:integrase/recombinase XerD